MGDLPEITLRPAGDRHFGSLHERLDLDERRKVAVIGTRVREVLFGKDEDPLDQSIRINGVTFRVIGVFKPIRSGGDTQRADARRSVVPFTTFQSAFNFGDRVGWFALVPKDGVPGVGARGQDAGPS